MSKYEYRYRGRSGEHHVVVESTKEEAVHVFIELARRFEEMETPNHPASSKAKREGRAALKPPTGPAVDWEAVAKKMPTRREVEAYIRTLPDYKHSHPEVSRHFFGRILRLSQGKEEHQLFFRLQRRIEEARKRIAKEDTSHEFRADSLAFGKSRTYRWVAVTSPKGAV